MILKRNTLSGTSLLLLAVLFVSVVLLTNTLFNGIRLDLTENSLYTLSDGTHKILQKLEEPIKLSLYFSDKATAENNRPEVRSLRLHYERVRELLEELKNQASGKIKVEIIDPIAFSEDEDRAVAAGLQGIPIGSGGEKIFFGLVSSNSTTGQEVIPFFDPTKEAFLEYDFIKLIHSLSQSKKPQVGLISGLPMAGGGAEEFSMQMPESWVVYQQLTQLFEVKNLNALVTKSIDPEINVLVVVHPKQFPEDIKYAIDQFVMRGGHLVVFFDPNAEQDNSTVDPLNPTMGMTTSKASDLPELFKAWGVEYQSNQVLLDKKHALEVSLSANSQPVRHPGILHFNKTDLTANDVITANLTALNLSSTGFFKVNPDSGTQLIPLLQSSIQAMPVPVERVSRLQDPASLLNGFAATGERYVIAGRLKGKFKTAFPNRTETGHLAETKEPGEIVLVADTDLLTNRLWVRVQDLFGQKLMSNFADNGSLFINAIDNLTGSSDLISIRGRGLATRPFTRVEDLKVAADDRFRLKEQELQTELSATEHKLIELQNSKDNDQKMLLSSAQQEQLEHFINRKLEIRKELRNVRRHLDAEIDDLGASLKFINIALLPILLGLGSLLFLGWQAKQKAK